MELQTPEFANEDEEAQYFLGLLHDGTREQKMLARDRLGRIFERRDLLDEAAECYETNIELGVRERGLYERLAGIYRRQGRIDLAEEVLEEARKLPPPEAARPARPTISPFARPASELEAPTQPMPAVEPESRALPEDFFDEAPTLQDDRLTRVDIPRIEALPPRPAWYEQPAVIVLGLLLCGPLGIALMWAKARWTTATKAVVTAVWLVSAALILALGMRAIPASLGDLVGGPVAAPSVAVLPPSTPLVPVAAPGITPSPSLAAPKPAPPAPAGSPPAAKPEAAAAPAAERVRVANTGGDGANLRERPSSSSTRIKSLRDGTVLEIVGANQEAEGEVWRNVRDASGASGWIVSDYLEPAT